MSMTRLITSLSLQGISIGLISRVMSTLKPPSSDDTQKEEEDSSISETKTMLGLTLGMISLIMLIEIVQTVHLIADEDLMTALGAASNFLRIVSVVLLILTSIRTKSKLLFGSLILLGVDSVTTNLQYGMQICDLWLAKNRHEEGAQNVPAAEGEEEEE